MAKSLTTASRPELPLVQRLLMGKSDLTRQAYEDDLLHFQQFIGQPLGEIPNSPEAWQQLSPDVVKAYLEWLGQQVSPKTGRPYSTATIARRITAVKELLTEALWGKLYRREDLEYIQQRIKVPTVSNEHHGAITAQEQALLLETAARQPGLKGLRDYALFRLWLETGIRRAELAALKVRDLTIKEGIPQLVVRKGKGNKTRSIPLENYTDFVVRDWLKVSGQGGEANNPIFCQVRKAGQGTEASYIIPAKGPRTGQPARQKHLSGAALLNLVKWYAQEAGLTSKITPHSFRATLITDARAGGATNKQIMATTGHSDARMIDAVYDRNQYNEPVARLRKHELPKRPQ